MEACLINVETFATAGYELESRDYSFVLIGPKAAWDNDAISQVVSKNSYNNGKVDFEYKVTDISRHFFETQDDLMGWLHGLLRHHPSIDVVDSEYGEVKSYTKIMYEATPIPWFAVQDFVQPFVI